MIGPWACAKSDRVSTGLAKDAVGGVAGGRLARVRPLLAAALAFVVVGALGGGAPAGAAPLAPVADRYEPGQTATLVGYTGAGSAGWADEGPFRAYLSPANGDGAERLLGELTVVETGHDGWRALRASITFTVPDDVEPGSYTVAYCNAACTTGLGELQAGTVSIGADPESPAVRVWSLDEPEIANLPAEAVIAGPGYEASAAVIRADLAAREPPPTTTTSVPVPVPVPVPPAVTVITVVAAPPPAPGDAPARTVNGGWLAFGSALAVACVGSVLVALRQGHAPPRGLAAS